MDRMKSRTNINAKRVVGNFDGFKDHKIQLHLLCLEGGLIGRKGHRYELFCTLNLVSYLFVSRQVYPIPFHNIRNSTTRRFAIMLQFLQHLTVLLLVS